MDIYDNISLGIEKITCAVCHNNSFQVWQWPGLLICDSCRHIFKKPFGKQEHSPGGQLFYFNGEFVSQEDSFTRFYERLNNNRRLHELKNFIPQGKVLEVGVGRGQFLDALKQQGFVVEGMDLSKEICDAIQVRYRLPMICGDLVSYSKEASEGIYSTIIMCHVLEHIEAVLPTLKAIKYLLKKEGILYLAVPNIRSWNAFLPGWTGYQPYHIQYFHLDALKQVLESYDFTILSQRSFEPISGWFNTIFGSIRSRLPNIESINQGSKINLYNKTGLIWILFNLIRLFIGVFLSPLRWLQSALGRGEELVIIARSD